MRVRNNVVDGDGCSTKFCDIFYMGLFLYGRCLRFIALYTQKLVVVSLDNSSTKSKKWNVYRHFSFRLNFPFTYCYLSKNDLCLDSQRGLSWEYELFAFTVLEEKVDGEKKLIDLNIEFFLGHILCLKCFRIIPWDISIISVIWMWSRSRTFLNSKRC